MPIRLSGMRFQKFKAYGAEGQDISLSGISVLMGANSSGKSTCIQGILALKQTMEGNQEDVDLLLNGKYTALGVLRDVVYHDENDSRQEFSLGIDLEDDEQADKQDDEQSGHLKVSWNYTADEEKLNKIGLDSMELHGEKLLRLKKDFGGVYNIESDGIPAKIEVELENLTVKSVIIPFDADYNSELIKMMKELVQCAVGDSKIAWRIDSNVMITNQMDYITKVLAHNLKIVKRLSYKTADMDKLIDLTRKIEDKLRLLDDTLADGIMMPIFYQLASRAPDKSQELELVYKQYDNIMPAKEKQQIKKTRIPFDEYLLQRSQGKRSATLISMLARYNYYIGRVFRNLRYLGPLREAPKSIYQWNVGVDSEYVGPRGEFFTAVLANWQNKEIETILSTGGATEKCSLKEALYDWCEYLNVARGVKVQADTTFGITVQIASLRNKDSDIMNVGAGTSQVIPVLLMGLLSPKNATLIYEQPELHLHPYSQSRLADFFVAMMKLGRQIIIETHSEYMLHRIRYNLAKKNLSVNEVQVNFFDNRENGTVVFQAALGSGGGIEYPDNFVDQNQSLFRELLKASLSDGSK